MMLRRRTWIGPLIGVLWVGTVGVGMRLLWGYAQKPGAPATDRAQVSAAPHVEQ